MNGDTNELRIAAIEKKQARTDDKILEVSESQIRLEAGNHSIMRELHSLSETLKDTTATVNTPKTNDLKGTIIAIIAGLTLLASFAYTVLTPIIKDVENLNKSIMVIFERYAESKRSWGSIEERANNLELNQKAMLGDILKREDTPDKLDKP